MSHSVDGMIDAILEREGGFVDHPNDRGGPTNFGITQATLSGYLGKPVTRQKVKDLNVDLARDIYETQYYLAPRINNLPEPIQPFVFDCSINHGPRRAIRFVQSVCNDAGFGPLIVDGVIGPATRLAANSALAKMGDWFLAALVEERRNFYDAIVRNDPSQEVFLRGWMRRADEFDPPEIRQVMGEIT
ncbi:MAG: glycosyl hydrolase 108 family protein [Pseudomonadota bacterium]